MQSQTWFRGLVALLLASLIALVVAAVDFTAAARRTIEQIPSAIAVAIAREGIATRSLVTQLGDCGAVAALKEWRRSQDRILFRVDAVDQPRETRQELLFVTSDAGAGATKLLDGAEESRVHWSKNLEFWNNCHGNDACWQAQFTALLGATRVTAGETFRTKREVCMATPKIAANVKATTGNVVRLTRPKFLGMRVIKMVAPLAGGALFGEIK